MAFVEDEQRLRGRRYARPVRFVHDRSLANRRGAFRYVFEEGSLSCSVAAQAGRRICLVSREEMSAVARQRPSFVYADTGCWVDNADGGGTRRRDFVLVCGPHVYLCELAQAGATARSRIASVDGLFAELAAQGVIVSVNGYLRARDMLDARTLRDPTLYMFMGDLHLAPVSWFFSTTDLVAVTTSSERQPPRWMLNLPAMRRQGDYRMRNYYSCAQRERERGHGRSARGPISGNPDIFQSAGRDLVRFVDGLCGLPAATRSRLHFIQTGDMLELWLGRPYQYEQGHREPAWLDDESSNRVSDWALEIAVQNTPVFEAFRRLDRAGLAEVKYLWGNHDAYLKSSDVASQVGLPRRDPSYRGLNGDLFAEHGHRFDRSNHDNTSAWSGPAGANAAYYIPVLREAEPLARQLTSIGHPSRMRDCYLLGATLIHLYERYDQHRNPFSIYVMGHSHDRKLFRFDIRTEFHLYDASG
jgi:hypothetical protein